MSQASAPDKESKAEDALETATQERMESLKARYTTKKPDNTSKGKPSHLNPVPAKHKPTSTGN